MSSLGLKDLRRKPTILEKGKPAKADPPAGSESMRVEALQVRCKFAGHAGRSGFGRELRRATRDRSLRTLATGVA